MSTILDRFNTSVTHKLVVSIVNFGDTTCNAWKPPQHILFQIAQLLIFVAFLFPNVKFGNLALHACLTVGCMVTAVWSWHIICAPDMFFWGFGLAVANFAQTVCLILSLRQVKFPRELEDIYEVLFEPMNVSRLLFKRLISIEYAQILNLHAGEAYAMQNLTKTDRLGLLVAGKASVLSDHHFLHHIHPREFLDSPEFESTRSGRDEKYKVTILAVTPCRYVVWNRQNLEYLLVKETFLATIFSLLIERDIVNKLYAMNDKIVTERGSHLDIRLPSVTGSMAYQMAPPNQTKQVDSVATPGDNTTTSCNVITPAL